MSLIISHPDDALEALVEEIEHGEMKIIALTWLVRLVGGRHGSEPVLDLLEAVPDAHPDIIEAAIDALVVSDDPDLVSHLLPFLENRIFRGIRRKVVDAFAGIGGSEVLWPLVDACSDEHSYVREGATLGLTQLSAVDLQPLSEAMDDDLYGTIAQGSRVLIALGEAKI